MRVRMKLRVAADWMEGPSRHNHERTPKGWVEGDKDKMSAAADMLGVRRGVRRISTGPCIKGLCGQ